MDLIMPAQQQLLVMLTLHLSGKDKGKLFNSSKYLKTT